MTHPEHERRIFGGVDTHGRTHHAAVIDELGRHLADREFPATTAGYRDLHAFLAGHGALEAVGVEGTGAYGAELARRLADAGVSVIDYVNRMRIALARELIVGSRLDMERIAERTGFSSARQFRRAWSRLNDWTPSELRATLGQEAAPLARVPSPRTG